MCPMSPAKSEKISDQCNDVLGSHVNICSVHGHQHSIIIVPVGARQTSGAALTATKRLIASCTHPISNIETKIQC